MISERYVRRLEEHLREEKKRDLLARAAKLVKHGAGVIRYNGYSILPLNIDSFEPLIDRDSSFHEPFDLGTQLMVEEALKVVNGKRSFDYEPVASTSLDHYPVHVVKSIRIPQLGIVIVRGYHNIAKQELE